MKALISPNEKVYNYDDPKVEIGIRVAEVTDSPFPIGEPLFWFDCDETVIADRFYYNNGQIYPVPVKPKPPKATEETGPVVV